MSFASRFGSVVVTLATACGQTPKAGSLHAARTAIIDGTPDTTTSAAALIRHRDEAFVCSGAAVALDLVVTARHCVVSSGSSESPLAADGFRIGFGPDEEHLLERFVERVEWIDEPDGGTLADARSRGEDVALLHLQQAAPADVRPLSVRLEYTPRASDDLSIVGFGVSSLSTGSLGIRLRASVVPSGFDPPSGVLQVSGPSACFGDSGGPLLFEPQEEFVGLLGEVGGSDAGFCDIGLSFAVTMANIHVRSFLERACMDAGGCGPRFVDAGADADATGVSDARMTSDGGNVRQTIIDGASSSNAPPGDAAASADAIATRGGHASSGISSPSVSGGSACSIALGTPHRPGIGVWLLFAAALMLFAFRRSSKRRFGPRISLLLVATLSACAGNDHAQKVRDNEDGRANPNRDGGPLADSRVEAGTGGEPDALSADGSQVIMDAADVGPDALLADGPLDAPRDAEPVSVFCGDSIRDPVLEECDDGSGDGLDTCTPDCRARDAFVTDPLAAADGGAVFGVARQFGSGPHVAAASRDGFAIVYQEADTSTRVYVQAFDAVGHRQGEALLASEGRTPAGSANPVIAVISAGLYAVAWTDGTDGTPDIAMRTIDVDSRVLGPVRIAHDTVSGVQQDPDILPVNGEWVVAWTDLFAVHVRRFNSFLSAVDAEEPIPQAGGLQSGVALAENTGTWALAWRANDAGADSIHVVAGANSWFAESRAPGPSGDRPALASVPDGNMVVVFSAGREDADAGQPLGDELRAAALDAAATGTVSSQALSVDTSDVASTRPRAARIGDRVALVWQSEDAVGGQALPLLGEIRGPWNGATGIELDTVSALAVTPSVVDKTNPILAPAPHGAFVGAWEDWSLVPGRPIPDLAHVFRGFLVNLTGDGA